jgi:hypothetical protein
VFTYSLLCAAFLWLPTRTHWSMIALGLASAQNPPIAALIVPCALYAWHFRSVSARDLRVGAIASFALAALHPAYYLYRTGRVTALTDRVEWPTIDLWGYVVWDPNVGLMFGDPWPLVIVALGVVALVSRRGRAAIERPLWAELGLAMLALCLFILAFAQTQNVNHGATPGMSRYALWLVPLTIPLWRIIDRGGALVRITAAGVSIASIVWTLLFFRPALPEGHLRPTSVAQFLWTGHPGLNNPLPEIFAERLGHREHAQPPIGTEGCEKVLLAEGRWPATCVPVPAPPICLLPQALCYGNRTAGGYAFVPTTSRGSGRPWTIR